MIHRLSLLVCFGICSVLLSHAQPTKDLFLEQIINDRLTAYPFSSSNLFRLAIYTELKGKYYAANEELRLSFGEAASISFYPSHCLLKKGSSAFHLSEGAPKSSMSAAMDIALDEIFEQIMLMTNSNRLPQHIAFVDKWLSKKNIEPFHKIFSRYLLLAFGQYNPRTMQVSFHSRDIPASYAHGGLRGNSGDKIDDHPLKLVLDTVALRGYYLKTGGNVFVNDVDRDILYATGEDFHYNNITAYKLFIQHLFTTSIHHIAEFTRRRKSRKIDVAIVKADKTVSSSSDHPYQLGSTIIGLLKAQDISITDPSILKHLLYRPFFPDIYKSLDKEQRKIVDRYRAYGWHSANK